jgi:hypothetical protein
MGVLGLQVSEEDSNSVPLGLPQMTQKPRGKKLVYVSEDIVDSISEITKKRGESITKFVEDTLSEGVKVEKLGYAPEEASEIMEVIQVQRVLGGTFVPLDVLHFISSSESPAQKQGLDAKWHDSGKLYGRYIRERFSDPIKTFRVFLKVMRWDLNEIGLTRGGDSVSLRCVSTSLNSEGTLFLFEFLKGAMAGMGLRIVKSDCMKGMILMDMRVEGEK